MEASVNLEKHSILSSSFQAKLLSEGFTTCTRWFDKDNSRSVFLDLLYLVTKGFTASHIRLNCSQVGRL